MSAWLEPLLVIVLLLNFFVLGVTRLPGAIYLVGLQGILLGMMALLVHGEPLESTWTTALLLHRGRLWLLVLASVAIKGVVIPRMLLFAVREVGIRREIRPLFGFVPCVLLGAIGTGLAVSFASTLPLRPADTGLIVPTSLSTVLTGFLLLLTRLRAITQALGYLVLENGIFIFGLLLLQAMPEVVEFGVLLDLFVGVFVMGIIIQHISRGFASDSTELLQSLKE